MKTDMQTSAKLLRENDRFHILIHAYPDGDTIGGGYALCRALRALGKQANVVCAHTIAPMYRFLTDIPEQDFEPQTFVSVDVADLQLLGAQEGRYTEKILLAIDHHGTNKGFARYNLVDPQAAAACELVYRLIHELDVPIDAAIANCLYTGISTDTGCFKYDNTTPVSHVIAAEMILLGADYQTINRVMFETKTRARIELERMALSQMEFHFDDRLALITITKEMRRLSGAKEGDLEGLTSLPRQVEGVLVGVTFRERDIGGYKISVRTHSPIDAAAICEELDGGGHARAAGCTIAETYETAKQKLLDVCRRALGE